MGKYDYVDVRYFSDKRRFAELVTNGLHKGVIKVYPEELTEVGREYPALSNAQGNLERDVLFLNKKHRVMYGIEVENFSDLRMPERCLVYDACEYEKQIAEHAKRHYREKDLAGFLEKKSKIKESDGLYPVCNLVLYLGPGKWRGWKKMQDLFQVPKEFYEKMKDKIIHYEIPIVCAEEIHPEDYETDLRQFFLAMKCRGDKDAIQRLMERVDFQNLCQDAQNVIVVHLGDDSLIHKVVEEGEDMCKAMRDWRAELLSEGEKAGREAGEKAGREAGEKAGREAGEKAGREAGKKAGQEETINCLIRIRAGAKMEELIQEGYSEMLVQSLLALQ